ncbi:tetratricopeptide repeat protein [Sphingomonas ginkgonis]|uniref:Tetratricopeptide repeat protein n=1 Tax=Sphingomonas ginkgonis TaxID=2315330 RepID=A0A429V709_9SPHN|nr:LytR C-terminal domain-containing protein [Sphingomonas ginkgonis]RST29692.1 tetratricopeptide repeat protein [Sphingomonas ginkgonis]
MMRWAPWPLLAASAGALAACAGAGDPVAVRPLGASPLAAGEQPLNVRVAEGRAQFALGNVALALEAFRKGLREDPTSVDALNGMAACYDRMGRFDLSRRYYEDALAIAPGDPRLYRNLALSLTLQGRTREAAALQSEYAARLKAAERGTVAALLPIPVPAPNPVPAAAAAAAASPAEASPPPTARSVTVRLAAAAPALPPARLERLSLGEVALVTGSRPLWAAVPVRVGARSATFVLPRARARGPVLTLLNASRIEGLARRTRLRLQQRGWRNIAIGNAPRTATATLILYPAPRRPEALRLAAQFGVTVRQQLSADPGMTLILARDAAGSKLLRSS